MQHQINASLVSISPSISKDLTSYIEHTVHGLSIRAVARASGVHPSTIMRRVRKLENRRDDPLVDAAVEKITIEKNSAEKGSNMPADESQTDQTNRTIEILEALSIEGAFLALASDMENAVIMQSSEQGELHRRGVVSQADAQNMALNEWISITQKGRIAKYEITDTGQSALKRLQSIAKSPEGFAEQQTPFSHAKRGWSHRVDIADDGLRVQRTGTAESPLTLLSRRKGKDGKPFLDPTLVAVGERLREDFELSHLGSNITQNWDAFLTGPNHGSNQSGGLPKGTSAAQERFQMAMEALGPGLSEIALHCCCHQRGMEVAERKMGWSARSGKIVLRIALQRLKLHYEETHGKLGPMIG